MGLYLISAGPGLRLPAGGRPSALESRDGGATHPPFRGLNFSHFFLLVVTFLDSLHSYQEDSLIKMALLLWK